MQSLNDDFSSRFQRNRKNQLYRQMLDEQIKQNNYIKQQNHIDQIRPVRNSQPYYKNQVQNYSNLPLIGSYQNKYSYSTNFNSPPNMQNDDIETQYYLDNCEQIIKKLKQLKIKKKSIAFQHSNSSEQPHTFKKYSIQENPETLAIFQVAQNHYPKPQYFGSDGRFFAKSEILPKKNPKQIEKKKQQSNKLYRIIKKQMGNSQDLQQVQKSGNKQKKYKSRKRKSIPIAQDSEKKEYEQYLENKNKSSIILSSKQSISQNRKDQQSLKNQTQSQKQEKKQNFSSEASQYQCQLISCIKQLTAYLKKQNQKYSNDNSALEQQKSIGKNQSQKQVQNKTQIANKQKENKDTIDIKLKILDKFRILNRKSQQFFIIYTGKGTHKQQQNVSQRQQQKNKKWKQKVINKNVQIESDQKSQDMNINKELVQIIGLTISQYNNSNEQLKKCFVELRAQIKDQNQIINQRKDKKILGGDIIDDKKANPFISQKQKRQLINQNLSQTEIKQIQQKYRQSVLIKLKKARIRGSLFKEKIFNMKGHKLKSNQNLIENNQQKQAQMLQNELKINQIVKDQTNLSNEIINTSNIEENQDVKESEVTKQNQIPRDQTNLQNEIINTSNIEENQDVKQNKVTKQNQIAEKQTESYKQNKINEQKNEINPQMPNEVVKIEVQKQQFQSKDNVVVQNKQEKIQEIQVIDNLVNNDI